MHANTVVPVGAYYYFLNLNNTNCVTYRNGKILKHINNISKNSCYLSSTFCTLAGLKQRETDSNASYDVTRRRIATLYDAKTWDVSLGAAAALPYDTTTYYHH